MITKKNNFSGRVFLILTGLFFAIAFSNCSPQEKEDDLQQAAASLRDYAIKSNPALKGTRFKVNVTIDGALGDCMCLKVCDSKGENCTECTCIPAKCGGCD